jgi:hypothetical protein
MGLSALSCWGAARQCFLEGKIKQQSELSFREDGWFPLLCTLQARQFLCPGSVIMSMNQADGGMFPLGLRCFS